MQPLIALIEVEPWIGWGIAALVLLAGGGAYWRQSQARQARKLSRLRPKIEPFFKEHIPFYRYLNLEQQQSFVTRALDFLTNQRMFYVDRDRGQNQSLESFDPSLAWRIAAAAAIISSGLEDLQWPEQRDILVYPEAFDEEYNSEAHAPILGMVHAQGPILFSARELRKSFEQLDGHNVAIHELAHVLDMADGYADGALAGSRWTDGEHWEDSIDQRQLQIRRRRYQTLRAYAGTNSAEFFAVALEVFFEDPKRLQTRDPELYQSLSKTFRLDPAAILPSPDQIDTPNG